MVGETLEETVERLIPHIDTTGKGAVVVDQLREALARRQEASDER